MSYEVQGRFVDDTQRMQDAACDTAMASVARNEMPYVRTDVFAFHESALCRYCPQPIGCASVADGSGLSNLVTGGLQFAFEVVPALKICAATSVADTKKRARQSTIRGIDTSVSLCSSTLQLRGG